MLVSQKGRGHVRDRTTKLGTFDVTSLVVGSIIGADVYVATAIGARLVGPASLVVWVLAGAMAMTIALCFAYCVMMLPKVGGPYAYVRAAVNPFVGFLVGWGLLLAEWFSLAVFPVAFTQYFLSLVPGIDELGKALLKGVFIAIILVTNLVGVKTAGRVNDALTIAKLTPLLLIVVGGIAFLGLQPGTFASNLSPFVTGDLSAFGRALVLIFWAYAGFELSTLPTDEVERPGKTIPRAIVIGMLIVIAFYLFTNLVVMGAVGGVALGVSTSPLIDAAHAMFGAPILLTNAVVIVVGVGALLSITGADESGTVGTSRLAYAMSIDGLLPEAFSRSHSRFKTPYLGLIVLCLTAYVASLLGGLTDLISSAVFLLALVYFVTCISTILLERKHPRVSRELKGKRVIPVVGAFFSLVLMGLVNPLLIGISLILLAIGVPVYVFFSPRHELQDLKAAFWSAEAISRRAYAEGGRFLAYPLRMIERFTRREP
ncbi:MAG: amino acid permease [Methanobacteriota archaeon]|nr:MAG: amino acid permease [Euryarchaeota archaeon]